MSKKKPDPRTLEATALLAGLEGRWTVARRIAEASGREGSFEGTAVFTPDAAGGMDYREDGWLALPGAPPMRAGRRYRWQAASGRILVRFADGRAFHDFAPGDPRARHLCGADVYEVRYRFGGAGGWVAAWRVTGPSKSYTMLSRYRR